MYPTYSEVFEESNNWENKEALWKHRWYAGTDGHGSSNGNYKLNRNDEYFPVSYTHLTQVYGQQSRSISGVVKNSQGETIIGANIVEKGTNNGTITNLSLIHIFFDIYFLIHDYCLLYDMISSLTPIE